MLTLVASACSSDDDAADPTDGVTGDLTGGAGLTSSALTAAPPSDPVTETPQAPEGEETAPPSVPSIPPPTAAPESTGVPGLDSDDSFCAAWSRFGGSWQVLVQAGAMVAPAEVARLEVIASTLVDDAYDDVFAVWPAELESERDVVAQDYFGTFQRRSADAARALADAGASPDDVVALSEAWSAALEAYDPLAPAIAVAVPAGLDQVVDSAATAFAQQRVPLPADPSMVVNASTPLTDEFLATACPDQGWIVGQDVGA
jgi:hypothetical protein